MRERAKKKLFMVCQTNGQISNKEEEGKIMNT